MRAAVVIPVFNHAGRIAAVVREALALGLPVFVVDDGSTDRTAEILAPIEGITVLRHQRNLGKGAALLTGFAAAASTCDWALTLDGDGQHRPVDGWRLLDAAQLRNRRVVVIGNRQGMAGEHVPWTSRFGRLFSNFWVWAVGGPWVRDSQSGFRLYPLPEILHCPARARRYQWEVEILVLARRRGLGAVEVPISVVYQPRGERISHFRPWVDFCRNSATFSRLLFERFFPWLRAR
ncbi:MAG: glycosyltransferase family 2 protein [Desulfobulbus sp.]